MKKNKQVIMSGCSYTEHASWGDVLFDDSEIHNFARSGAGNAYISNSIMANIDPNNPPNFVFILWSGINRIDIRLPKNNTVENSLKNTRSSSGVTQNSMWLFSGGKHITSELIDSYDKIKDKSWDNISSINEFYALPKWIKDECIQCGVFDFIDTPNLLREINLGSLQSSFLVQYLEDIPDYYTEITFKSMVDCFSLLERYDIKFKFSFIYDIFSKHSNEETSLGKVCDNSYYAKHINWDNYVDITPYEYGLKNDLMDTDDFHLTEYGMKQWAQEIKHLIK